MDRRPRLGRAALAGLLALVALVARGLVVAWAAPRIPAAADGTYYHTFAERLSRGAGYTWAWPDGAVTYASHYPVGYPALLALPYRLFGAHAGVAMAVNAVLGALLAVSLFVALSRAASRGLALGGALVVALHPALVPYTPALMTEGVTTTLVAAACAVGLASRRRSLLGLAVAGLLLGAATLARPQCIVLAPAFGIVFARARTWGPRLGVAAGMTALALAVCAPWTVRNCVRMESCALVSVNGGWNLLIGAQTRGGAWEEVKVPDECRAVWDEAGKDACFGRAARRQILADPRLWVAKMPQKLAVTFDYFGGAPWYLHQANPEAFPYDAKVALGALETVASRVLLIGALVAMARLRGRRRVARFGVGAASLVSAASVHAWPAYLGLVAMGALLGVRGLLRGPGVVPAALAVVGSTAALHAVFFGGGRYGLVAAPFVAALGFVQRRRG
ncbi:MAG: glycosyltransferase family 39 protein [Myxococcales bacterium]|nr:glycosyltransferase family 39 protein [Myxococcales bacterium]MBL0193940.1 glycosyltransferase family 39 protein [Myxococcales bacterium]HQY61947.1 glycosyltransferase family 39 protein [Polyangiaceae bacterium]